MAKTSRLIVRMRASDMHELRVRARRANMNLSDWVRTQLLAKPKTTAKRPPPEIIREIMAAIPQAGLPEVAERFAVRYPAHEPEIRHFVDILGTK